MLSQNMLKHSVYIIVIPLKQSNGEKNASTKSQKYSDPLKTIPPHVHSSFIHTDEVYVSSRCIIYVGFLELGLRLANEKGYVKGDYV